MGVVLWALALVILVLITRTLRTLQIALLVVSFASLGAGVATLFFPDGYRRFVNKLTERAPAPLIRLVAVLGILLGSWLLYLGLTLS